MAVTDWKSPGTVVDDDIIGFFGWSSPDNAKVNDGVTTAASVNLTL